MARSKGIDILRTLAVFLVMVRHMAPCPADAPPVLKSICDFVSTGGIGVTLSFVLSGFLVAGLLFRERQNTGDISFSRFFIRRGLKIYPAFWALLLVTVGVAVARDRPISTSAILGELLFVQNYFTPVFGHTWSLAVEEHFYLLLAVLLLFLSKRNPSKQPFTTIPLIVLAIAVECFVLRCALYLTVPFDPSTHLFPTHLRLDALFFGVFLAYRYHYHRMAFDRWTTRFRRPLLIAGPALMTLPLIFQGESTPFIYTIGMTLVYLGCGFFLLALLACRLPQHPVISLLAALGSFSYAIYLWHLSVANWGTFLVASIFQEHWNWYWHTAVYFVGSIVVGIVMTKLVESPFLRFRDRHFPSRTRATRPIEPDVKSASPLAMSPSA
jgi:peptidoglycan/LPS O-acetylase OafA/YrhL